MFTFTESWLQYNIRDAAIQLEGMMAFRADRDAATSGKSRGGGLCLYINKDWSVNATLVTKHWPFYLLRDFIIVIVAVVYIATSANAKGNANNALGRLHDAISELLTSTQTAL